MEGTVIDACVVDGTELVEADVDIDENGMHVGYVCKGNPTHYYRGVHLGGGSWAPVDQGDYDDE